MIYEIKNHLLEEGILQHVKENIGKYALGAAGIAAAGAGEFGDSIQNMTHSGADAIRGGADELANSAHRTMDHYSGATGHDAGAPGGGSDAEIAKDQAADAAHAKQVAAEAHAKQVADAAHTKQAAFNKLHPDNGKTEHGTFIDTKVGYGKDTYNPETGAPIANRDDEHSLTQKGLYTAGGTGIAAAGAALMGSRRAQNTRMKNQFNKGAASVKRPAPFNLKSL